MQPGSTRHYCDLSRVRQRASALAYGVNNRVSAERSEQQRCWSGQRVSLRRRVSPPVPRTGRRRRSRAHITAYYFNSGFRWATAAEPPPPSATRWPTEARHTRVAAYVSRHTNLADTVSRTFCSCDRGDRCLSIHCIGLLWRQTVHWCFWFFRGQFPALLMLTTENER